MTDIWESVLKPYVFGMVYEYQDEMGFKMFQKRFKDEKFCSISLILMILDLAAGSGV